MAQALEKGSAFAVIQTGGKQYLVREGQTIFVEKLNGKEGDTVTFSEVLLTGKDGDITHGTPFIDGKSVTGEIVAQTTNKKVIVMKFKAKSNYFVKNGHKQPQTRVKITSLS